MELILFFKCLITFTSKASDLESFVKKTFDYRFNFFNRYGAILMICPYELLLLVLLSRPVVSDFSVTP